MAHSKLRKETNCLNCGAEVRQRYCPECGQENVEPKQTLGHLLSHFFSDVTHFDGKFFITIKRLLLRPGFLTEEYVNGRRAKYVDPVRMYLFVSFAFFLLYLAFARMPEQVRYENDPEAIRYIDSSRNATRSQTDFHLSSKVINGKNIMWIVFDTMFSKGIKHYEEVQKKLPDSLKSDAISLYFERKLVATATAYNLDPYSFFAKIVDRYNHSVSKVFFISLPIFTLLLALLYIRRRKDFYYVSHAIFTLHFYVVVWILLAIGLCIKTAVPDGNSALSLTVNTFIYLGMSTYLYLAMLRFYKQGWFKTFMKFLIQASIMGSVIVLIVLGLVINSFFAVGV